MKREAKGLYVKRLNSGGRYILERIDARTWRLSIDTGAGYPQWINDYWSKRAAVLDLPGLVWTNLT